MEATQIQISKGGLVDGVPAGLLFSENMQRYTWATAKRRGDPFADLTARVICSWWGRVSTA